MKQETIVSDSTIFDTLSKGFTLMKSNFWFLMFVTLLLIILSSLGDEVIFNLIFNGENLIFFLTLSYTFLIASPLGIGFLWINLKLSRGENVILSDLFEVFKTNYLNAVLASILVTIILILGFILLLIPGIYLSIRLFFVSLFIVDKKMGPIEAIGSSWEMSKGKFFKILGLVCLFFLVILLGLLLLIIGIIPAIAWISSSQTILYNSLLNKELEEDKKLQSKKNSLSSKTKKKNTSKTKK